MNKSIFYIKRGRRYYPVEGDPTMPADGIWEVNLNGNSKRCVLQLSDLPNFNTPEYLGMQVNDHADLCTFLSLKRCLFIISTLSLKDEGFVSWTEKSNNDFATDIIQYLSMNDVNRKKHIDKLKSEWFEITSTTWDDRYEIRRADQYRPSAISIQNGEVEINTDTKTLSREKAERELEDLQRRVEIYKHILTSL